MKRLLQLHRYCGAIACLAILAWSLSGVLHTVMMRLQPHAVNMTPPIQSVTMVGKLPLKKVLLQNHVTAFQDAHVVVMDGNLYYQLDEGKPLYFDAETGKYLENGELRHSELLARHYINDGHSKLKSIRRVIRFDQDYAFINRLLPVYQVSFDRPDGMAVYVELTSGKLGTITNTSKIVMGRLFQNLHTWSFLQNYPYLKLLMLVFLACGFLTSISGIYLYFRLSRNTSRWDIVRQFHRHAGLLVSLVILAWTSTGAYHLLHTLPAKKSEASPRRLISPEELLDTMAALPKQFQNFRLFKFENSLVYRVEIQPQKSAFHSEDAEGRQGWRHKSAQGSVIYIDAKTGQLLPDGDLDYAKSLASHYSRLPVGHIKSQTLVNGFNDEYGFIFKRLPVYRIVYGTPSNDVYFVETATGKLAAHLNESDLTEGRLFAFLHKWAFLAANQDLRDIIVTLLALCNALVAMTGLMLFSRKTSLRPSKPLLL